MASYEELYDMICELYPPVFEYSVNGIHSLTEKVMEDEIEFDSFKNAKVEIRPRERNGQPHFHIYVVGAENTKDGTKKKQFHTCICLNEAKYFDHGTKNGKLNNEDIDIMISILKKQTNDIYKNIWHEMASIWNKLYSVKVDLNNMPNYEELKGL